VHEVGPGVTTAKPGDAVLVYPPYACGMCVPCRRANDVHCVHHGFTGLTRDGGFAEYVLVDERSLLPLPDGVEPAAVAPHADAGVTAYHAVQKLKQYLVPGTTAAVIGAGGVGHIALQLLQVLGAGRVVAIDTDERRRALARELGADEVLGGEADIPDALRQLTNGAGADVVLDVVGTDATHMLGQAILARRGVLSFVGYGGTVSVPSVDLVVGETTYCGNLVGTWIDLWELLQLHVQGKVELRTETHRLDDVNDVLQQLRDGEVTGRAVLVP
jgi:D-arabinose 1-dehydrogenase-like Zn-dependent alcohol dehydrogenase